MSVKSNGIRVGKPVGYLELVRGNPNFRRIWFGEIISYLGDWFNLIGSAALIAELTGSGLAVGVLFVLRTLAPFLISPLAGVAADRYNRKHLLIFTDLTRAATVLAFLLVREPGHVWLLYTLTFIQMAIGGVFFPTRNAILPNITSAQEVGAANALGATTWSVMLAFGAALGGVATGLWGIYPAFVIDAVTYLVSAAFIARIHYEWTPSDESGGSLRAALESYTAGLQYLREHADILVIALHKTALGLAVFGALQIIQVLLAQQVFVIGEGGSTSLGIMYTATGVGTGIGPLLARRFTADHQRALRKAIFIAYAMGAIGLALVAFHANFAMVVVGLVLEGLGSGVIWVFSTQLLMQLVPDRVQGRVFSTEFALMTLASTIATASGGWLLDNTTLGILGVVLVSVVLTVAAGVFWALWTSAKRGERSLKATVEVDLR